VNAYSAEQYANVGELIDGGKVEAAAPTVGVRTDGFGLFYRGQVNSLFGNPETGKTLIAMCAMADELNRDGSALLLDLDHNGAGPTVARLISMGVDEQVLRDPDRFRYAAPDDAESMAVIVADTRQWQPTMAVLDSIGELMPMYGASSNSPDDWTRVHGLTLKPLADCGAAVITIDHLAKNVESQTFGATGTTGKKRTAGGANLRVVALEAFTPGKGGRAQLTINKDRHGGLRAVSPIGEKEPLAATFILRDDGGELSWVFKAPEHGERSATPDVSQADMKDLAELSPPPVSQRDVKDRLGWGSTRALRTLQEWRRRGSPTVLPAPQTPVSGAREHSDSDAPGAHREHSEQDVEDSPRFISGTELEVVLPAPHTGVRGAGSTLCKSCGEPLHPLSVDAGICPSCPDVVTS
jgi:hypothetical protein